MHIEELVTNIQPLSRAIIEAAQKRFDNLIKPVGSLAQLESMTTRYAGIIGSSDKQLVTVPETRLLLLWGEAKHAAEIEAVMLQKKAISVYASHVNAKVIPLLIIGETAYDLLEEGAMLTGEYIGEEKAGLICLGTCEDESVLLVHASPPGVRLCGTKGKKGTSKAVALAEKTMQEFWPDWYERFPKCEVPASYLKAAQMRWNMETFPDAEEIQSLTPEELLALLLPEAADK